MHLQPKRSSSLIGRRKRCIAHVGCAHLDGRLASTKGHGLETSSSLSILVSVSLSPPPHRANSSVESRISEFDSIYIQRYPITRKNHYCDPSSANIAMRMLSSSRSLLTWTCLATLLSLVSAHTVITYPGWRGDNLLKSGSIEEQHGLGVGANDTYPYGMQWIYPCGHKLRVC